MKIENKYVKLKIGNKFIQKKNMILDLYLNGIRNAQLGTQTISEIPAIRWITLKFDEPMEVDYSSVIPRKNYDIMFQQVEITTRKTKNSILVNYVTNDNLGIYTIQKTTESGNYLSLKDAYEFNGRKITGIGFCNEINTLAYLDTSEYNLIFDNSLVMEISRMDLISTDGYVNGYFDYPFHLAQNQSKEIYNNKTLSCRLYSIGLGFKNGIMSNEYLLEDNEVEIIYPNDYSYELTLNRTNLKDIQPSQKQHVGIHPLESTGNCIVYKYRLYISTEEGYQATDEYFTLSIPVEKEGNLKIITKIERGD